MSHEQLMCEIWNSYVTGNGVAREAVQKWFDELDSQPASAGQRAIMALCATVLKQPCVPVFKKVSVREQLLECLRVQFPSVEFRLKLLNIYVGEVRAHSRIGGSRGRVALLRVVLLEAGANMGLLDEFEEEALAI
jgi:ABC-type uncharacterized transport system YnjBCD ATPase subunit